MTPPRGTYLGGFARLGNSNGVLEPLRGTVVAFEGPGGRAAFVFALDLVFAHAGWVERLRHHLRQAIGREDLAMTLNCSHSHQTPYGTIGAPKARFQDYADALSRSCLAAATKAWEERELATLHFGSGETSIGINRRMPGPDGQVDFGWFEEGFYDKSVGVLQLRAKGGRPLATLANHGCHPISMPPWSRKANPDWVGPMRKLVDEVVGAPTLFIQGACADINPRHEWLPRKWGKNDIRGPHAGATDDEARQNLGRQLGQDVIKALQGPLEQVEDGPVDHRDDKVWLPLEPELDAKGERLPYWRGVLRSPQLPRVMVDALLRRAFPWVTDQDVYEGRVHVPLVVQSVRIGSFALVAHGSEAFNATGLALKNVAPTPHAFFAGYSNGMVGYVPTPEAVPRRGYEVDTAPYLYRLPGLFSAEAEPLARARSEVLTQELFAP